MWLLIAIGVIALILLILFLYFLWKAGSSTTCQRSCPVPCPPPPCPEPCPSICAPCPPCPPPAPVTPPTPVPVTQPPLDTTTTTTDTNNCAATWKFPPNQIDEWGHRWMYFSVTPCFVPGKCLIVQIPANAGNCVSGQSKYGFAFLEGGPDPYVVNSYRFDFDFAQKNVTYSTGQGGWPQTVTTTTPNLSNSYFMNDAQMNELKFCCVTPTQTDLYINGAKVGTYTSPVPVNVGQIGIDAYCINSDIYGKVV